MFEEFETTNKAKWLEKVEKDLKGKSIDELDWKINEQVSISPFAAEEDIKEIDHSVLKNYHPDWQVGEEVKVENYKEANKRALAILMSGVTAISFHFKKMPTQQEFNLLFENIGIEFIAIHFTFDNKVSDFEKFYNFYKELLIERKLTSTKGSFAFPFNEKFLASILTKNSDFAHELIHVNSVPFYNGDEFVVNELRQTIETAKSYFKQLSSLAIPTLQIAQQTFFTVSIGKSFLLEIAKLRALKLLWVDLLKSYSLEPTLPFLKVVFNKESYRDSKHDNLINASTLAMSAICGGANHLIVHPDFSKNGKPSAADFRLARNVQLILKHESGFHEVADPANGSYYVEQLTAKLVKAVKATY